MTSTDKNAAARARMAETGENYTTALRRINEAGAATRPAAAKGAPIVQSLMAALFEHEAQSHEFERGQYPRDERHASSAAALKELATFTRALPDDDPVFLAIRAAVGGDAYGEVHRWLTYSGPLNNFSDVWLSSPDGMITAYGFHVASTDHYAFLEALAEAVHDAIEEFCPACGQYDPDAEHEDGKGGMICTPDYVEPDDPEWLAMVDDPEFQALAAADELAQRTDAGDE